VRSPDVVVVGGGVIGCAVARALARSGASVTVLERDRPGEHASWAAAGMLTPLAECDEAGPFLSLARASRARFPALAAALLEETRIDVGYRDEGTLLLALSDHEAEELQARYAWQSAAGLAVERLEAAEARRLEPAVTPALRLALRFPEDHQVDSRALTRALWFSAAAAGADVRLGARVERLLRSGPRAAGVELQGGERVAAGRVVIAGGSWAGGLAGLPRPLPVRPVHGQLAALETGPPLLRHVVGSARGYLVPRADGRLIAGTTVEEIGYRRENTPEGVSRVLGGAVAMAPALARLPLVDLWSGLRPGTPDGLPILGPDPEVGGLLYATGHYRNGILLAPLTAELIATLALGGTPDHDLHAFRADRFDAGG
jgi:glycine oxidase